MCCEVAAMIAEAISPGVDKVNNGFKKVEMLRKSSQVPRRLHCAISSAPLYITVSKQLNIFHTSSALSINCKIL